MASFLRVLLGGFFVAASALLSVLAPEAPPELRTKTYVALVLSAFLGAVFFADQIRRGRQTPGGPSGVDRRRWMRWLRRPGRAAAGGPGRRVLRLVRWLVRRLPRVRWPRLWPARVPAGRHRQPQLQPLPPRLSTFRGRQLELCRLRDRHRSAYRDRRGRRRRWHSWPGGRGNAGGRWWPGKRRRRAGEPVDVRPLLFVICGMAGVGKSALVQELAHQIRDDFPDGQFYENLGHAGSSRSVGEVLRRWLVGLGWPAAEIPVEAEERAQILRSLTRDRRMLFVLDAARDPDQVHHLMPGGPGCSVLVTSRQDFGPAVAADETLTLGVPSVDEALELLAVYAPGLADRPTDPECAVRVVEQCGRLPGAIRAVCDQINEYQLHLCSTAEMLRTPRTRVERLTDERRSVWERIDTEYLRLDPPERQVLRFLSLVRTETFVPWAASAMLAIPPEDAEDRVAQLGVAQLLQSVGRDQGTGLDRYSFHPLVRLFAARMLAEVEGTSSPEVIRARERIDLATLYVTGLALEHLEPGFPRPAGLSGLRPGWLPADSTIPARIAEHPLPWIRNEYRQLVQAVQEANRRQWWPVVWRVAVLLGVCLPEPVELDPLDPGRDEQTDIAAVLASFGLGLVAADRDGDPFGRIKVLLAKSAYLTAVERYADAELAAIEARDAARAQRRSAEPAADRAGTAAGAATSAAGLAGLEGPGPEGKPAGPDGASAAEEVAALARRYEAAALGRLGSAYLQMGDRRTATWWLDQAQAHASDLRARSDVRMLDLLRAEALGVDHPVRLNSYGGDDLLISFEARLVEAEKMRRLGDWPAAAADLHCALELAAGDARRVANARYRLARLSLDQWYRRPATANGSGPGPTTGYSMAGVTQAVQTLLAFQRMGNPVGAVRARCLLVRALTAAGRLSEAEVHCARAVSALRGLPASGALARSALTARLRRAHGELLLEQGRQAGRDDLVGQAREELTAAVHLLDELGDWQARDEIMQLRDGPRGRLPDAAGQPGVAGAGERSAPAAPEPGQPFPRQRSGEEDDRPTGDDSGPGTGP